MITLATVFLIKILLDYDQGVPAGAMWLVALIADVIIASIIWG